MRAALRRALPLTTLPLLFACSGEIPGGASQQVDPGAGGQSVPQANRGGAGGMQATAGAGGAAGSLPPPPPPPPGCGLAPTRIWRLSPEQYANTIQALFGAPRLLGTRLARTAVQSPTGFSNSAGVLDMSGPHVEQLHGNANDLAVTVAAAVDCRGPLAADAGCWRSALLGIAQRAFRRPLADDERGRYEALFAKLAMGRAPNVAFLHAARAVFLSPHFLYRTELGGPAKDGRTTLTSHERASALSYLLTNGPPDAELMAAADRNQLTTPEQITAHATRLLKDAETAKGVFAFLSEHFGYDGVRDVTKDEKLFPGFSKGLAAELAQETATFLRHVLWADDGRLGTILNAPYSMLTPRLQGYYGMSAPKDDAQYRKIMLPEARRGLLTQGSFLARTASSTDTNPVGRGVYIRGHLLCQEPPPPPADLMIPELSTSKTLTTRERLAMHNQPTCAGCHRLMDDLGLAFENYDPSGKFRMLDAGKPIDAKGTIADFDLPENTFANAVQLAERLSRSPRVRACFAERFFEYAHGRAVTPADACEVQALQTKFESVGGDVRALIAALAASDGFLARRAP